MVRPPDDPTSPSSSRSHSRHCVPSLEQQEQRGSHSVPQEIRGLQQPQPRGSHSLSVGRDPTLERLSVSSASASASCSHSPSLPTTLSPPSPIVGVPSTAAGSSHLVDTPLSPRVQSLPLVQHGMAHHPLPRYSYSHSLSHSGHHTPKVLPLSRPSLELHQAVVGSQDSAKNFAPTTPAQVTGSLSGLNGLDADDGTQSQSAVLLEHPQIPYYSGVAHDGSLLQPEARRHSGASFSSLSDASTSSTSSAGTDRTFPGELMSSSPLPRRRPRDSGGGGGDARPIVSLLNHGPPALGHFEFEYAYPQPVSAARVNRDHSPSDPDVPPHDRPYLAPVPHGATDRRDCPPLPFDVPLYNRPPLARRSNSSQSSPHLDSYHSCRETRALDNCSISPYLNDPLSHSRQVHARHHQRSVSMNDFDAKYRSGDGNGQGSGVESSHDRHHRPHHSRSMRSAPHSSHSAHSGFSALSANSRHSTRSQSPQFPPIVPLRPRDSLNSIDSSSPLYDPSANAIEAQKTPALEEVEEEAEESRREREVELEAGSSAEVAVAAASRATPPKKPSKFTLKSTAHLIMCALTVALAITSATTPWTNIRLGNELEYRLFLNKVCVSNGPCRGGPYGDGSLACLLIGMFALVAAGLFDFLREQVPLFMAFRDALFCIPVSLAAFFFMVAFSDWSSDLHSASDIVDVAHTVGFAFAILCFIISILIVAVFVAVARFNDFAASKEVNAANLDNSGLASLGNPSGELPWSTSLFGCFSDLKTCFLSCFCPCYPMGLVYNYSKNKPHTDDFVSTLMCCAATAFGACCCALTYLRHSLRVKKNIRGDHFEDIATACCCPCCGLAQMYREIDPVSRSNSVELEEHDRRHSHHRHQRSGHCHDGSHSHSSSNGSEHSKSMEYHPSRSEPSRALTEHDSVSRRDRELQATVKSPRANGRNSDNAMSSHLHLELGVMSRPDSSREHNPRSTEHWGSFPPSQRLEDTVGPNP